MVQWRDETPGDGYTDVTVAFADHEHPSDLVANPAWGKDPWVPMVFPFSDNLKPLVQDALNAWSYASHIRFIWMPDNGADQGAPDAPDIRIGIANLQAFGALTGQAGDMKQLHDEAGYFLPGVHVVIENPGETPVTAQPNGDYTYTGQFNDLSVLQVLVHEIGHAIGLDHPDPADPNMVMNHLLTPQNYQISERDIAAASALYGGGGVPPERLDTFLASP
jgi:matrixin